MASLDALFGAMLIGVIVCSILLGVLTVQVCSYYANFKNDPLWMKFWVAAAYAVDVLHQVFGSWLSYRYAVSLYTCRRCLGEVHWSVGVVALLEPLSAGLTQLWFARRLYQFNKNQLWLVVLTVALSVISMIAGLASASIVFHRQYFIQFGGKDVWHVTIWFVAGFLCDVLVTVPVAWSLYHSRTGFRSTDRLLTRLAIWIINTGALTTTIALLGTVVYLVYPHTLIYISLHIVLASLYSNSLVAFLNRRGRGIRTDSHVHRSTNLYLSQLRPHRTTPDDRRQLDDLWGDPWVDPWGDLVGSKSDSEAHDLKRGMGPSRTRKGTIANPISHGAIMVDIVEFQNRL
ncbi:uncharacterized protein EI90DRAFT_3065560 [Cantharellus anzutake]|uniref:uncharacterized protein n=1 Tax=Cantharellus anzutake TaxID=1750568 RepID=UPI0019072EA0|nr:uncharacterized protein EI90DRAFT_3065560 [Cantharellus anzutake]KAF8328094.1 hypothetical protein EI90DRAFT_3065560 [Cantharellus anzutake]